MVLNNISRKKIYLDFIVIFICLFSSVIVFFLQNYKGYEYLFTQPLIYSIVFVLVFSKIIIEDKTRVFFWVLALVSGTRYVILPLLTVLSGHYGGRSMIEPDSVSFYYAILLMNYEFILVGITIKIIEITGKWKKKLYEENELSQFKIYEHNLGYYLFFFVTFVAVLIFPSSLNNINFIIPNSLLEVREPSTIENITAYCFIVTKQLIFILLLKKFYIKYSKEKKEVFVFLCFLLVVLNTVVYLGTNRSDILISSIVSFIILFKLFGRVTRKYIFMGLVFLFAILMVVSGARNHTSISRGLNQLIDLSDTFQVYVGGIYNVAIALETKIYYPEVANISVLFFDIFRPIIGINIFIKQLPFKYSNIYFNQRIWLDSDRRSQIIPMVGQGNIFFGYILAPAFSILVICFYYYLEKKRSLTTNIEVFYFLTLVVVRLGFFMGQNTSNIINDMSMNLVLFLLVFYFNKLLNSSLVHAK